MKNSPRLAPLFVALSVVLAAVPPGALAQVVARPVIAPAAISAGAAAASGVSALPTLAPLAALTPFLSSTLGAAPSVLAAAPALAAAPIAASLPSNAGPAASAALIRTPGAAASGIAAEAAEYAGDERASAAAPAAAPAARRGLAGRLADVVMGRASVSALFDSSAARGETPAPIYGRLGLQKHKPIFLPNGSRPDEQPTTPSPDRERTVQFQTYSLPGARDVGGVLETSRKTLSADPNDVGAVVEAVKALVDSDRARYGVSDSELRLIGARKFSGHGEQADTIFIHFRQVKDNLIVNGANMSFTLKVLDGKPTIVAQTGQLFPQIDVDTQSTLTETQIMGRIAERVGIPAADATDAFRFSEEKIIYSRGSWRHAKLYVADGLPFMIAVDLATGLVFAWDDRAGLKSAAPQPAKAVSGSVGGMAIDHGPILPNAKIVKLPLSYLNLTIGGKTYTTDKDGKFSAPDLAIPAEGLALTAALSGPYVNILDSTGKTLEISMKLMPGDGNDVSVLFNPNATTADENALSQVSAFHKVNLAYNFLKDRKLTTERMDKEALKVRTNVDEECNADYSPGTDTMRNFKASENCVNSSYDTVDDHEYGHRWDHMTGGIMNGGLSEGWGDTLSMYLLNNPVIGEHFLKHPGPDGRDYIRHGDEPNPYQYNEFDEVHEQGKAWGGFTWKLRKALIKELGDAAGAAMAEALVLPTMFAKASTIPDAMAQVLVNAMKKDGTIQFEAMIRATAKIHGITLPNSGKGLIAGLVERFTAPLRSLKGFGLELERGNASTHSAGLDVERLFLNMSGIQADANDRATVKFTAGAMLRNRVANEIRRYMDETGLKYQLHEYKSWTSSDFLLVIEGPQDKVQEHANNISRWLRSVERARN